MTRSIRSTLCITASALLWTTLVASPPLRAQAPESQAVMPCTSATASASQGKVRYPVHAQRTRREGSVTLQVLVAADGSASKVVVRDSSGSKDLDKAARVAARSAVFCRLDGHTPAAQGYATMRVDFKLDSLLAGP